MRTISLKLPEQLIVRLEKEAKTRRVTRSRLMRESRERALDEPSKGKGPSCYDLAKDLIRGPKARHPDLATNPKYMEGFGE
jgi:metal-responsive CopG/Arc/MetJ family transcriptional regulator